MIAPTTTTLTREQARDLTDRINSTAGDLCLLLVEAHEREAWRALGYDSWRAYATAELEISKSQAYRILDHGRVTMALLNAVTDDDADFSPNGEKPSISITEVEARDIKPVLDDVVEEVKERVAAGEKPADAVKQAVASHRPPPASKPAAPADEPGEDDEHGYGSADDHQPDLVVMLEQLNKDLEERDRLIESLSKDDSACEIRSLHAKLAQLNANHNSTLRTLSEARKEAEYAKGMLTKIRRALKVERDRDILPKIQELVA